MLAQKLDGSLVCLNAAAFTNGRKSRLIVAFNTKQETNHPRFTIQMQDVRIAHYVTGSGRAYQ